MFGHDMFVYLYMFVDMVDLRSDRRDVPGVRDSGSRHLGRR